MRHHLVDGTVWANASCKLEGSAQGKFHAVSWGCLRQQPLAGWAWLGSVVAGPHFLRWRGEYGGEGKTPLSGSAVHQSRAVPNARPWSRVAVVRVCMACLTPASHSLSGGRRDQGKVLLGGKRSRSCSRSFSRFMLYLCDWRFTHMASPCGTAVSRVTGRETVEAALVRHPDPCAGHRGHPAHGGLCRLVRPHLAPCLTSS